MGELELQNQKSPRQKKIQKSSTTIEQVSKDRRLTRLSHYPLGIIVTFTYTIPLVGLIHLVRTLDEEISTFPITIRVKHVRYKFQHGLSNYKIVKALRC